MVHISVLLHESVDNLNLAPGAVFLDGTVNSGGHSAEVLTKLRGNVTVVGLDMDADALARAKENLGTGENIHLVQSNFRNLDKALDGLGIKQINGALFDLGISSNQIEESGRGFTFRAPEPLLMTMKANPDADDTTAYDVVNNWQLQSIVDILTGFGEEQFAWRIANAIVAARELGPIKTSDQLAAIITGAVPLWYRFRRLHPATKTFQAIRIAVNDELGALSEGLQKAFDRLAPGGRLAVISFHSLEDRIVKHFFKKLVEEGRALGITKKPILPSDQEQMDNPRSRSAKLRVIEKI
jgi:16S rRNA (cytosine1402-N4)-methyltransferase